MSTPPSFAAQALLLDALATDEALYDRLAASNPAFRKFAKVLLREDTAGRLTLGEVASIVGIPTGDLLAIANGADRVAPGGCGSGCACACAGGAAEPAVGGARPDWLAGPEAAGTRRIDVRPLLENGHEPLADILDLVAEVGPREILVVDAPFHPVPLRRLLGRRGYESHAESLAVDHWRVWFRRGAPG